MIDLVKGLISSNRRMSEEHIAFIIKEVVKVCVHIILTQFLVIFIILAVARQK